MAMFFRPSLRGTYCSMAPDIPIGRTEIEAYNGHLIRLAGEFPCPLNRAALDLVVKMTREGLQPERKYLQYLRIIYQKEFSCDFSHWRCGVPGFSSGGAGFLGSHLVEQLLAAGQPVRVLERPGASVDHLPLDRIELVSADIRDEPAVREAARGCDYVYHLAADANLWRRDRGKFDRINRLGTVHVMRAALDNGAKRILYTSTESILSPPNSNGGAVENLRLQASDMLGPYCLSKFHAEEEVFRLVEQEGAPIIVIIPTLPVGPGDRGKTPPTRMSVAFCKG